MALTIKLSASQLTKKKDKLEGLKKKLETECNRLDTNINQINKSWDGDASNTFIAKYNKEKDVYNKFIKLVEDYICKLEQIIKNYEAAEAINVLIAK